MASEQFEYTYECGVTFKENKDGKITCGRCKQHFHRIISHLQNSDECSDTLDISLLKTCLFKFKKKISSKKYKEKNKEHYKELNRRRKRKSDNLAKEIDSHQFKEKQRSRRKKCDNLAKLMDANDSHQFKEKQRRRRKKCDNLAKLMDADKSKEKQKNRQKKCDEKAKSGNPTQFRSKICVRKRQSRENLKKSVDAKGRLIRFMKLIRFGPIFSCICCHQKLYEDQVEIFDGKLQGHQMEQNMEIYRHCIDEKQKVKINRHIRENGVMQSLSDTYICKKCKKSLESGKMPKLCIKNGLAVDPVSPEIVLTELEANLIAKNIIFQKFHKKAKSRWSGTHDRLINIPISEGAILNTIENLPRTPSEAGIISVKLKRKLELKGNHIEQTVDSRKVFQFLSFLKNSGHPGYKFYDDLHTYEDRCEREDPEGFSLIYPNYEEIHPLSEDKLLAQLQPPPETMHEVIDEVENHNDNEPLHDDEEEIMHQLNDAIRKNQFDYDQSTCMTAKFPEAQQKEFTFAPGTIKFLDFIS